LQMCFSSSDGYLALDIFLLRNQQNPCYHLSRTEGKADFGSIRTQNNHQGTF